jgi:hypothetical protein
MSTPGPAFMGELSPVPYRLLVPARHAQKWSNLWRRPNLCDFSVHHVRSKNCCFTDELQLMVVSGATGCGKTHLLRRLAASGQQVLDLEFLAKHKGARLPGYFCCLAYPPVAGVLDEPYSQRSPLSGVAVQGRQSST